MKKTPALSVNTDAIKQNAQAVTRLCQKNGISVAGVIKISDGAPEIARAYLEGGCAQIAVSRACHLPAIKKAFPEAETLLTRAPTRAENDTVARYADLTLMADEGGIRALNESAARLGARPGVILMLDVGDLREGVETIDELVALAKIIENECKALHLRGVGTNLACLNGVLPTHENLSFLVMGAEEVEKAIGRHLDIISGASSINMLLLWEGENKMPARVNHLRIGGFIANPITMRTGRGVTVAGMREDSLTLEAEIIEVREKPSVPTGAPTKNWAGKQTIAVDRGRRIRAILAVGEQDVGMHTALIPLDEGVEIVGGSSDHTIVDLTDASKAYRSGDVLRFRVKYAAALYAFTGKHIAIEYTDDKA